MGRQKQITVSTTGKGLYEISDAVRAFIDEADVQTGLCNVFVHHTSASIVINENADPNVLRDLEDWMRRHVQDGDPAFLHTEEGTDDMSAHVRAALTASSVMLPITGGKPVLGVWQGVFLWEHRHGPMTRKVTLTALG